MRIAPSISRRSAGLLASAAVCLAASLPYFPSLDNYFVRDDFGVVELLARKPALYFPRWFVTSWNDDIWGHVSDEVRPFPAVSYQLTALGGPASPFAHHVLNVALHAANGLVVFALALGVAGLGLAASTFAALVFVLLPVHGESVAWITGRVDTMPTLFYIATLLAYARWRTTGSRAAFGAALALFFLALFTKQTTITMIATLASYDLLILRRIPRPTWKWVAPYVPFALMTAGYLILRRMLFGQMVRADRLTVEGATYFGHVVTRHLANAVAGSVAAPIVIVYAALLTVGGVAWILSRTRPPDEQARTRSSIVFFGPLWWIIGVAPIVVAGYESPRHVYLAAVGWAMLLGIAFDELWRRPRLRRAAVASAAVLLAFYSVRLHGVVREWDAISDVSHKAVRDVRSEVLAAPPGSLVIAGAPTRSWEWSVPFSVRPPFTRTDLTSRAFIVTPWLLHCCRGQWFDDTRRTLRIWLAEHHDAPIIVLRWDPDSGALSRVTDREYPALRSLVEFLPRIQTLHALDDTILRMVEQLPSADHEAAEQRTDRSR